MKKKSHLSTKALFVTILSLGAKGWGLSIVGQGEVSRVTVFQDRASVSRNRVVQLTAGSHSIAFEGVTALLDKESIKARLPDKNKATILGIRTQEVHTIRSTDKNLNELRKKKEKLENDRNEILAQIDTLIRQDQNMQELMKHYQESFAFNLHKKGWKKGELKAFVAFLDSHSFRMNSTWKGLYLKHQSLQKDLEFTGAKITERAPASAAEKQTQTVWVDLTTDAAGPLNVQIQYLVPNAGWSSAYDLSIHSASGDADLIQKAFVWQRTGESWKQVNLFLSNARTELHTNPPSISTYTLNFQDVKEVKTGVTSKSEDTGPITVGSGAETENSPEQAKTEKGLARLFTVPGLQSVRDGLAKTAVPIASKKIKFTELLEVVAEQYPRVFRKAEMENSFAWDLAPGPMSIYQDGQFVQQTLLNKVARGDHFSANIGIETELVVNRSQEDKTEEPGLVDRKRHFIREYGTHIENFSAAPKKIRVLARAPVSELKDVEVTLKDSTPGYKAEGKIEGWYKWDISVPSRKTASVNLKLDVAVPKDFQFSW